MRDLSLIDSRYTKFMSLRDQVAIKHSSLGTDVLIGAMLILGDKQTDCELALDGR